MTSVFVVTVIILVKDILMWSTLFFLFIFTYASAFILLLPGEEGFTSFDEALVTVFRMSVGDFSMPFSSDASTNKAAVALWVTYTFLVPLLYMNVLIAMMSKSFEIIGERASAVSSKSLAMSLVNWEATLHVRDREKAYFRVCPGQGKHASIRISNDLGFGFFRELMKLLQMDHSDSRASITIDNDVCTMFTKNERTWKEIELQEELEKEDQRFQEMADMKEMLISLDSKMSEKIECGMGLIAEQMGDLIEKMEDGKEAKEEKKEKKQEKKQEGAPLAAPAAAGAAAAADHSHDEVVQHANFSKMKVLKHFGLSSSSEPGKNH